MIALITDGLDFSGCTALIFSGIFWSASFLTAAILQCNRLLLNMLLLKAMLPKTGYESAESESKWLLKLGKAERSCRVG